MSAINNAVLSPAVVAWENSAEQFTLDKKFISPKMPLIFDCTYSNEENFVKAFEMSGISYTCDACFSKASLWQKNCGNFKAIAAAIVFVAIIAIAILAMTGVFGAPLVRTFVWGSILILIGTAGACALLKPGIQGIIRNYKAHKSISQATLTLIAIKDRIITDISPEYPDIKYWLDESRNLASETAKRLGQKIFTQNIALTSQEIVSREIEILNNTIDHYSAIHIFSRNEILNLTTLVRAHDEQFVKDRPDLFKVQEIL